MCEIKDKDYPRFLPKFAYVRRVIRNSSKGVWLKKKINNMKGVLV